MRASNFIRAFHAALAGRSRFFAHAARRMKSPEFSPSDFFSRQDAARARTGRLVLWFALAVAGTVAAVYGAALIVFHAGASGLREHAAPSLWQPSVFLGCMTATLLIVGGASLFKSMQLAGGGGDVARSVGGRKVNPDTNDPEERTLLNIVEEMSLASGVPVPEVYILDGESAINAFAAGDSIENAAVAVTRGALRKLTRDELQAVMGHEFSHILNGDMRLNVRLIGWIFGLVAMTVVARVIMDVGAASSRSRSKNNPGAALLIFGVLVLVIGYIGSLFAQMIQASISRQREHLADASATQFTRNPEALANALRRIAGEASGTRLSNPHATEVAHMCFGEGVASLFATHPPLEERIRLLKPDWDGTALPPLAPSRTRQFTPGDESAVDRHFRERFMHASDSPASAFSGAAAGETPPPLNRPEPMLPTSVSALVRDPLGAQAAMLLLMMTDSPSGNNAQAAFLKGAVPAPLFQKLKESWGFAHAVPSRRRLAFVQLSAPALRRLSRAEADALVAHLRALADHDGAVSFFELGLIRLVASITHPHDDTAREHAPERLRPALRLVLGALLAATGDELGNAEAVSRALALARDFGPIDSLPQADEFTAEALDDAFSTLASAGFEHRRQALAAAEAVVSHDGVVNDEEADLLRALAAALRCPTGIV